MLAMQTLSGENQGFASQMVGGVFPVWGCRRKWELPSADDAVWYCNLWSATVVSPINMVEPSGSRPAPVQSTAAHKEKGHWVSVAFFFGAIGKHYGW
jgi:hypothetical protein